jgi:hypothetical protein
MSVLTGTTRRHIPENGVLQKCLCPYKERTTVIRFVFRIIRMSCRPRFCESIATLFAFPAGVIGSHESRYPRL